MISVGKILRPILLLEPVTHICNVCRLIGTTELQGLGRGLPGPFQVDQDPDVPGYLFLIRSGSTFRLSAEMGCHAVHHPVAVLINKAMIEIPPKFAGKQPVNPEWKGKSQGERALKKWSGAQGLAEDVRYYGQWMRDEAEKRIGHLFPKIEVTTAMVQERQDLKKHMGKKLTVIAWLWARTVKSPNPAFASVDVPLISTFMLSTKAGKEAYIAPVIEDGGYHFAVKIGKPKDTLAAKKGQNSVNYAFLFTPIPKFNDLYFPRFGQFSPQFLVFDHSRTPDHSSRYNILF